MGSQPLIVGTCSNPSCGAPIPVDHPYSWCSACGVSLPEALQAQLPRLQEVRLQAQIARERLGRPYTTFQEPISREKAAALYGVMGLLVFLAGVQSLWREPDTGGGGVAFGSIALYLAYQIYRGASANVVHALERVLLILYLVWVGIQQVKSHQTDMLILALGAASLYGLYALVRNWRKSQAEAS